MNAEQILIRTLLGGSEYRSVLYDVEPEMLPRGISTPGNIRFTVEKMSMFEEVYDAFAEELRAALARAMEKGEKPDALEGVPEAAHTLACIAYAVFYFGWATMPEMIDAIRRDFAGHEELQEKLRNVPPYGGGDEFQDSLGEQMEKEFKKAIG